MQDINEAVRVFSYNQNPISFSTGDGVMVNATEMAKAFGKRPAKWFELPSTKEFLTELETIRKSDSLIKTIEGCNGGTWMHEDVAMEFARWLSPKFAIWCNDKVKELLTTGKTQLQPEDDDSLMARALIAADKKMKALAQRNEELTQKAEMLEGQNQLLTDQNTKNAPKVDFYDNVMQSSSTFTFETIAKEMGMRSAHALIEQMIADHIIYRRGKDVLPFATFAGKGVFATRTHWYGGSDGQPKSVIYTVLTQHGRKWIHDRYGKKQA